MSPVSKPMTALSVLIAAKKLITPRKAWLKGGFGETASGRVVLPPHPEAVRFCPSGAVRQIADTDLPVHKQVRARLEKEMRGSVLLFNDAAKTTHRQVIAAFNRAIAKARKEQRRAA